MGEYTTFVCRECGYTAENIRWGVSANDRASASCRPSASNARHRRGRPDRADILVDEFNCLTCAASSSSWRRPTRTPALSARPRHEAGPGGVLVSSRLAFRPRTTMRDGPDRLWAVPARLVLASRLLAHDLGCPRPLLLDDHHRAAGRHPALTLSTSRCACARNRD